MNKYEIYTQEQDLLEYINSNGIQDACKFPGSSCDFEYIYGEEGSVNFFSSEECIDGCLHKTVNHHLPQGSKEVSPEEFLIAIGYLPEKVEPKLVSPIKVEDIHYICELDSDDRLYVERDGFENVCIRMGDYDSDYVESVRLSPEGLIELGSDLVRLGVALRDGTYEE